MGSLHRTLSALRQLKWTRWGPIVLIVALCAARLVQIWFFRQYDREFKIQRSYVALKYSGLLLLGWLVLLAWIRWGARFLYAAAAAALAGLAIYWVQRRNATRLRPLAGFQVQLWAAQPMLANPVAFCIDEQGRLFVSETHRADTSVLDIRQHLSLVEEDLACRTVEDRLALIQRQFSSRLHSFTNETEVIRLLEDRTGSGVANFSAIYATQFNTVLDGIASGVLARQDKVWFTNIPQLWLLEGTDAQGRAKSRRSLSQGYGVHINFAGHDLHGLVFGPEGKLYFSMGDRGASVQTKEGQTLAFPDEGTVWRCNPDGTEMEVIHRGLRNPQELAFDNYGNLFTGDNDSDLGDEERLVYLVEGGDSGWRIGYQHPPLGPEYVPWKAEEIWLAHQSRLADYNGRPVRSRTPDTGRRPAAYLPPVSNIDSGPAGLAFYPGTGLPAKFDDHFLLCHFTGSAAQSKIQIFSVKPKGAGYALATSETFTDHVQATDVDFGPDGAVYFSDWGDGWLRTDKGRIYRVFAPKLIDSPVVHETKGLLAEGMSKRAAPELGALLAHRNRRVRQDAQFELAARGPGSIGVFAAALQPHTNRFARLHAIWGLGQLGRQAPQAYEVILPLLSDPDAEVRAQAAKVLGDGYAAKALDGLLKALKDDSPRVRFFAALSLGRSGQREAVPALLEMLRANDNRDAFLRHAGATALARLDDRPALRAAAQDSAPAVRLGALLALRTLASPDVAVFLKDNDPKLVLEAARAINDTPIMAAQPELARLATSSGLPDFTVKTGPASGYDPLLLRALNAAFREGGATNAEALAAVAMGNGASGAMRIEALTQLGSWAKPPPRDRVVGLYRPLPERDAQPARNALSLVIAPILRGAPTGVRIAAAEAAGKLRLAEAAPLLFEIVSDAGAAGAARESGLQALAALEDPRLSDAIKLAQASGDANLRRAAHSVLAQAAFPGAATQLAHVVETGTLPEKQGAFAGLATSKEAAADEVIIRWLDLLLQNKVPGELKLDVLAAAERRQHGAAAAKLKQYRDAQPRDDELAGFRETLAGGDAARGRRVFFERADVQCFRCHKIGREGGGEVGPNLAGLAARANREAILMSLVHPNRSITAGFESVTVELKDGRSIAGVLKSENDQELRILSPEHADAVRVSKSDIASRVKGLSGMPEGLVQALSLPELRDLVEFLASLK